MHSLTLSDKKKVPVGIKKKMFVPVPHFHMGACESVNLLVYIKYDLAISKEFKISLN